MSKQKPGFSVFVRNIGSSTTADQIRELFNEVGDVKDVYLPNDFTNNKPRGFGFVEFYEADDANEAIKRMDNKVVGGSKLGVSLAQDRRKSSDTMKTLPQKPQSSHLPYNKKQQDDSSQFRHRGQSNDQRFKGRSDKSYDNRRSDKSYDNRKPKFDSHPKQSRSFSPDSNYKSKRPFNKRPRDNSPQKNSRSYKR